MPTAHPGGELEVSAIAAFWRGHVATLAPILPGTSYPARAAHIVEHIKAQLDPSVWRPAGEALLVSVGSDQHVGILTGTDLSGYLIQAMAGLGMLDAAMAREQVVS